MVWSTLYSLAPYATKLYCCRMDFNYYDKIISLQGYSWKGDRCQINLQLSNVPTIYYQEEEIKGQYREKVWILEKGTKEGGEKEVDARKSGDLWPHVFISIFWLSVDLISRPEVQGYLNLACLNSSSAVQLLTWLLTRF